MGTAIKQSFVQFVQFVAKKAFVDRTFNVAAQRKEGFGLKAFGYRNSNQVNLWNLWLKT